MATNISIPSGTRDFSAIEMSKRNFIINNIKKQLELYGFQEIQTPAMEQLTTLLGKYGEEGDKLIFKILNSGDYLKNISDINKLSSGELTNFISEKGLRYDLTVPLARYIVQHFNEITLPFKRYQIQPVWRADRPQKGRYREFVQCDADIIGSKSALNELELLQIFDNVFYSLNLKNIIKINNRKILSGIAEYIDEKDKLTLITILIDKKDKIGIDKVVSELKENNLKEEAINKLIKIFEITGNNEEKLNKLSQILANTEIGMQGITELREILDYLKDNNLQMSELEVDLSLARGLSYYSGSILEVKAKDIAIGSICGGGRYDDLTGIFGKKDIAGVGISFGLDRIYDVMQELNLFPDNLQITTQILFVNFGKKEEKYCLKYANIIRKRGIRTEIYPTADAKIKKQMQYANNKNIPFVAIIGEDEMKANNITLKNMITGEQKLLNINELPSNL